jgi:hypothetical protein
VDIQCVELTDQISEYDCAIAGMAATFLHLVFSGGTGSQQHLGSHTSQKSGLDVCCKIHPAVALPRRLLLAAIADQPDRHPLVTLRALLSSLSALAE